MSLPDHKLEAPNPVACPECGEDMDGTTCAECGYEWDGTPDDEDGFDNDMDYGQHEVG